MADKLQRVLNWLEGNRDYATGLDLFREYGKDRALLFVLQLGESSLNRNKLEEALKSLVVSKAYKDGYEAPARGRYKRIEPEKLPKVLQEKWQNVFLPALTEAKNIHPQLQYLEGVKKDRACAQLVQLLKQTRSVLHDIDRWEESGYLPAEQLSDAEHKKYCELLEEALNIRNYLSRNKVSPKNPDEYKRREDLYQYIQSVIENGGTHKV